MKISSCGSSINKCQWLFPRIMSARIVTSPPYALPLTTNASHRVPGSRTSSGRVARVRLHLSILILNLSLSQTHSQIQVRKSSQTSLRNFSVTAQRLAALSATWLTVKTSHQTFTQGVTKLSFTDMAINVTKIMTGVDAVPQRWITASRHTPPPVK